MMMVMLDLTMRGQYGNRNELQYLSNVYSNISLNILVYLYDTLQKTLFLMYFLNNNNLVFQL